MSMTRFRRTTWETPVSVTLPPVNPEPDPRFGLARTLTPRTVLFDDTRIFWRSALPPSGGGGMKIIPFTRIVSGPGVLSPAYVENCISAFGSFASTTTDPAGGGPAATKLTPPSS